MSHYDDTGMWDAPRTAAEEALSDLRCELERITEHADEQDARADKLEERCHTLQKSIEDLEQEARQAEKDADKQADKIARLAEDLAEAAKRIESLEQMVDGYQEQLNDIEEARGIEQAALQAANELIGAQRAAIDLLQGSDERAHTLQGRVADLDRECADLAECMRDQRIAYDGLKADCDHLRLKLHDANDRQVKADTMIGLLTKERGQDIARILELEKQLRNAQSEASCWRESFELAHGQLKTAREDVSNATHELIDAHAALTALGVPGSEEESLIVRLGRLAAPLPK